MLVELRSPPCLPRSRPQCSRPPIGTPGPPARRRPGLVALRFARDERRPRAEKSAGSHDQSADGHISPEAEEEDSDHDSGPDSCLVPAEATVTGCRDGLLFHGPPAGAFDTAERRRAGGSHGNDRDFSKGGRVSNGARRPLVAGGRRVCCRRSHQREREREAGSLQFHMSGLAVHAFPFRPDCFPSVAARIAAGGAATVQVGKGSVDAYGGRDEMKGSC